MSAPKTMPTDTPLIRVLNRLDAQGYDGQFRAEDGGILRCLTCRRTFAADVVPADQVTRLEGASDPADMMIVVPLTCPRCGAKGVLVAKYGPESTLEEAEVVGSLERRRPSEGDGGLPTPGVGRTDCPDDWGRTEGG